MQKLLTLILILVTSACSEVSTLPPEAGYGADPVLPEPDSSLIPVVKVAEAIGWPHGAMPVAAPGLAVNAYAINLDHPRWLYVLPNGDVLVAESNAPPKPEDGKGIKGWFMKQFMKSAGAGSPSANRITLLRDTNGDGVAETGNVFLQDLNSPFGMTLVDNSLYVANTDALMRYPYSEGEMQITSQGEKVADLPGGPLNHHWTKNVIASADGTRLYVTVGSNSNVAENGIEKEENRAAILEINPATGELRRFATGLRNPNGMAFQNEILWTVVNERDEIGNDLVPDYLTSVQDGGFYGWPYSYYGKNVDERVQPARPDMVEKAIVPDYALGSHTASLGLAFYDGAMLPEKYREGAFIGQHGSWNRNPPIGYKVIYVPFANGRPSGAYEDILTGFLSADGRVYGRPVGVVVDKKGAVLVADDVGNTVWRVSAGN